MEPQGDEYFSYLIGLVIKMRDAGMLDDHLFQTFQSIADKSSRKNPELKDKTEKDLHSLVDYIHKNSNLNITEVLSQTNLKERKPIRIFMDGCFDLMHSGHYNAIRQAKLLGDILVVGVISNKEIEVNKAPPIMDISERAELVRACKWVDEVVENVPYNPTIELIDKLACPFVAHGDDMAVSADGMDSYYYIKKAGRMKTFKRTEGVSTTDIVGRLLLMTKKNDEKNTTIRKLSQDGEGGLTATNIHAKMESHIKNQPVDEDYKSKLPNIKLLQTTRRIRQFSSGKEPKPTDKIAYVDGSFDVLHVGHIRILQKAKEMSDFVIVGIHDDDLINEHKGDGYPVLTLQERVLNILSLKYCDEVIIGAPWRITANMIKNLNIQLVIEGDHESRYFGQDPYDEAKRLGIYKRVKIDCSVTTESIIERIIKNRIKYLQIQKIKEQKLQNYYKTEDFSVKEQ